MEEHVGVRAHEDPEVAEEAVHPADRVRLVRVSSRNVAGLVAFDPRDREERDERLGHADGTGARPSPAVRGRERLVGVDVHDVEPHVARPAAAEDRVQVRAVVVDEAAGRRAPPR